MKWTALFLVLFHVNALAGTIDPQTSDEKYIEYAKDFHCVLKICGQYEDDKPFCASTVAIAPNWTLTAAHVVKNQKITFVRLSKEKSVIVNRVICHKDFKEKNFGYFDIALCYTKEELNLEFYPEIYQDTDEVGKICSIAGWGTTGNFSTGANKFDGQRRAGSNYIDVIDRNLLVCTPSVKNKTSLEFLISHGDSGGGLFIGNKLAGINSCVMAIDKKPDSNYSDESGHTRLSLFKEWITENINQKISENSTDSE